MESCGGAMAEGPVLGERMAWRLAVLGMGGLALLNADAMDAQVAHLWEFLLTQAWFRDDMFEPYLAVASFFTWLHGWLLVDYLATSGVLGDRFGGLRRYRMQDQTAAQRKDVDVADLALEDLPAPNKWYAGWPFELVVYLSPLFLIATYTDAFAARRAGLDLAAPEFSTVCGQIFAGLFLYDFFFWFGHVAMHKLSPEVYRFTHGKHHINAEVRASDTVRLTMFEEVVDVMCSIAALRLLHAHPISRSLYNIVITFLLVELHCGYDMPWSPQNLFPQVFSGSRRHHVHHRSGRVYFGKFFRWMDDLAGFVGGEKDYLRETKAVGGKP